VIRRVTTTTATLVPKQAQYCSAEFAVTVFCAVNDMFNILISASPFREAVQALILACNPSNLPWGLK
jgi:hypothetical protein